MGWYPLVGLGLGATAWGVYAGLSAVLPALVAAALVVMLLELVTRGLHMDGLMDTCDGYFSGAPRERALEIMKDSRAGAMGVVGAVLVLIVKVAALGSLARADAAAPLLAGWAAARALPPLDIRFFCLRSRGRHRRRIRARAHVGTRRGRDDPAVPGAC